ncbi:MAG: helix-turn-helix transcriptional regulator, partial [Ruminococcus sp.]|nr:helix-turn-helix transcriptional regulator [Ruminococcus sp.]
LLHGASELYLCLDKAWNSAQYEGDEFLCCAIREVMYSDVPKHFKRNALLPALHAEREKPLIFYFSPLCFQMRLFGYTALIYDYPQFYDLSFREWNKTVTNALEFLRMKNDIHYLTQCQRISSLYDSLTGFYHLREFRNITEAAGSELSGDCFIQAIKLKFSDDGEYLYGENYRSDIISAAAKAVKQASVKREICCRASEDLFLILCKSEDGRLFSDKLKVMMYHSLSGKYDENQAVAVYAEYTGKADAEAVEAVCHDAERIADKTIKLLNERKKLPHYRTLHELRKSIQLAPKTAPSTEEICRTLCLSDGYFRVAYKKCFGVSYVKDCIQARIMLASYLLCTTAMSIYAVALKCGYTDEKYFARQFRQSVGYSPMRYRERYC